MEYVVEKKTYFSLFNNEINGNPLQNNCAFFFFIKI